MERYCNHPKIIRIFVKITFKNLKKKKKYQNKFNEKIRTEITAVRFTKKPIKKKVIFFRIF